MTVEGDTLNQRLTNPQTSIRVAQNFTTEWSMLLKDLVIGFLSVIVPDNFWKVLFLSDASP